ncbi:MAG: protease Lon-related BREX system protein BrxL, partial [Candidatus Aenigmatarchaeota archaeon]
MNDLNDKLLEDFKGRVVRKDLVRDLKVSVNVPSYVLEYLIGRYCSSNDPELIEEGISQVKNILSQHFIRNEDLDLIKHKIKEKGSYKIIDKLKVSYKEQENKYWAELGTCGLRKINITDEKVNNYEQTLSGGLWAVLEIGFNPNEKQGKKHRPFYVENIKPIQLPNVDVERIIDKRSNYTKKEWINLLIRSIGLEPNQINKRETMLLLSRLIPLVESNYNLVELGPRGTGKSFVYREISPYSTLISGGKTTVAKLFQNLNTGEVGLVGYWDTVAFDEVGGMKFREDQMIQMLKDYMESGLFSRGKESIPAYASVVYIGNIELNIQNLLDRGENLFKPFPEEMEDMAFLDRIHFYIPGWEIPKMNEELLTDRFGFLTNYLSEYLRDMRDRSYSDLVGKYVELNKECDKRDIDAIKKTVSGLIKLIHPDEGFDEEDMIEYIEFAIEGRRRVKEQLKKIDSD